MANQDKPYFYVTTPIYYASGNLHIGHAYSTSIADSIARYERLRGKTVFFLTGDDEHGQKIEEKAHAAGMEPQPYVDKIAESFQEVWKLMGITNTDFIRTTQPRHVAVVKKVFTRLLKQGDVYKGAYQGWYCTPCESFYTQSQLIQPGNLCPTCNRPCHLEKEEAYFLNCKKYVPQLLAFYQSHPDFVPGGKLNEVINTFIKPGLEDLCITRTSFNWGVPIDEDPKHVVYVWIDALLNYISALGYLSGDDHLFKEFWGPDCEIVQLIGREINRFHTIYWPILLFALNLRCPDHILVHGLLVTRSGVKLSKSLGNAPQPKPLIDRYGLDALRYYMVRGVNFGEDGMFTPTLFVNLINTDLANGYGNLVNRTISMIDKYDNGVVPAAKAPVSDFTKGLLSTVSLSIKQYEAEMDAFHVTKASEVAMGIVNAANKYIDDMAPWKASKEPDGKAKVDETMVALIHAIRVSSILLDPFLVIKAKAALDEINAPADARNFAKIDDVHVMDGVKLNAPVPLFPRLKKDEEIKWLEELIDNKQ